MLSLKNKNTMPVLHCDAQWDLGFTTDIQGVGMVLIWLIPVYAGAAKVVAGGTAVFAGIVPLVIWRLFGDYREYKTLFKTDCLCITVCYNMCVWSSCLPEDVNIGSTKVGVIVKV